MGKSQIRDKAKEAYKKNPEKSRNWNLISKYGITGKDYDILWHLQGEKCAVCGKKRQLGQKRFSLDHDHTTGQVRGILCMSCNGALGVLGDDVNSLEKVIQYLRRISAPSWDEYFLDCANTASMRSKDLSTQVGAVLVRDRRIISTGYNGFHPGAKETIDRNTRPKKYIHYIHAEMNCINSCAREGIAAKNTTMYITPLYPCHECARSIITSGVSKIVVRLSEDGGTRLTEKTYVISKQMFKEAGVHIEFAYIRDL